MNVKRRTMVWGFFSTIAVAGLTAGVWGQPQQEPAKTKSNDLSKDDDQSVRQIVAGDGEGAVDQEVVIERVFRALDEVEPEIVDLLACRHYFVGGRFAAEPALARIGRV